MQLFSKTEGKDFDPDLYMDNSEMKHSILRFAAIRVYIYVFYHSFNFQLNRGISH